MVFFDEFRCVLWVIITVSSMGMEISLCCEWVFEVYGSLNITAWLVTSNEYFLIFKV